MQSSRVAITFAILILIAAGAALAIGHPGFAITIAVASAAGAFAVWMSLPPDGQNLVETSGETEATLPLPAVVTLTDDAAIILDGNRIAHANAAALALFGPHIEDEDYRLAIRHPAVTDYLATETTEPLDVIGIGGSDRRFLLHALTIAPGYRMLRLADRTQAHVTDQMRTDFVANASHELRTPLATILGFIETLQDANRPEEAAVRARFLGIMLGEARRMRQLVDDLLSLSRVEADRFSPLREPLAVGPIAEEVAATIATAEALPPKRLTVNAAPNLPPVAGDRAQISQLLHNLISNALKYGRADTPIRIDLAREANELRLDVIDQGDGIPPEHLPRLTERFYRVDPGRSRAGGGTGLGLAIVKHIVERHRGRLEIDSTVGVGTRFRIRLPALSEPLSS